jgi:drug/metabolite transporter (DMT)-like permease
MAAGASAAHGLAAHNKGALLICGAAVIWSSGGLIARFITADVWTQAAGRGLFGCLALLTFLLIRDGRYTWSLFRNLGLPGIAVGVCFATASLCFVIALRHTTVATILIIQSTSPLIAGVIAWIWLREAMGWARCLAMIVALGGVTLMVAGGNASGDTASTAGGDSLGILLAMVIPVAIGCATVVVRRYQNIRMTPAGCVATGLLALAGLLVRDWGLPVAASDVGLLFLFGSGQLAGGLICFTIGARLVPAVEASLLGLLESVLAPLWVWIFLSENPGSNALIGGALVLAAVIANTLYDSRRTPPPVNVV